MKKYIVLAILASFIGILNPEILAASDKVTINDVSGAVETVSPEMFTPVITEVVTEAVPETAPEVVFRAPEAGKAANSAVSTTSTAAASAPATIQNGIELKGSMLETTGVAQPSNSVGNGVYNYANRYFYAHNPGKFTVLTSLTTGDAIKVVTNGAKQTYHVTEVVVMTQAELETESSLSNKQMKISATSAIQEFAYSEKTGVKHKIVLQTCLGENRLFVYAD